MKEKLMIISLFILLPNISLAEIKYNPWTGQWESAPRDSSLKYNPWENEWTYERDDSQLEYNPWTNEWKYER
tara:strand:+ start:565 stop:780 length:216 start_codon:yes stop_codon:yes gene_type:complete